MNYYQEITLLPDAEISPYFLWQKIYLKLHLALVNIQDNQGNVPIGVAFPAYRGKITLENKTEKKPKLGYKLRLFAENEDQLQQLNMKEAIADLSDYIHLTGIRTIPSNNIETYANYYRIQPKSSDDRIARRKAKYQDKLTNTQKREKPTEHQQSPNAKWLDATRQQCYAPFIHLKSQSNGQRFRLFIGYQEQPQPINQGFNSYGLSSRDNNDEKKISSTVPIFP